MNYLSEEWISEQTRAIDSQRESLDGLIRDLTAVVSESPRLSERVQGIARQVNTLEGDLAKTKAGIESFRDQLVRKLESRSREIMEEWQDPGESYTEKRLSEVREELVREVNVRASAAENAQEELAAQFEAKLSALQTVLTEAVRAGVEEVRREQSESQKQVSERQQTFELRLAALAAELERAQTGHAELASQSASTLAELTERLAAERTARGDLATQLSRLADEVRVNLAKQEDASQRFDARLSESASELETTKSAVEHVQAFVAWFRGAGPIARIRGER